MITTITMIIIAMIIIIIMIIAMIMIIIIMIMIAMIIAISILRHDSTDRALLVVSFAEQQNDEEHPSMPGELY